MLSFGSGGTLDALTADGVQFADWTLAARSGRWVKAHSMKVPIQYGSSGAGQAGSS